MENPTRQVPTTPGGSDESPSMVFIGGSPRSGTTMLARALGRHSAVHTTPELHVVGELWDPRANGPMVGPLDGARSLFRVGRGHHFRDPDRDSTDRVAKVVLDSAGGSDAQLIAIYGVYLRNLAREERVSMVCEQTPANLYYIDAFLNEYPTAKVVGIVRDPRDVLFSQKRWWRQGFQGGTFPHRQIPWHRTLRRWAEYNLAFTSMMWARGAERLTAVRDSERAHIVRYEDLIVRPTEILEAPVEFTGLVFEDDMVNVPRRNSSHRSDDVSTPGFDATAPGRWWSGLTSDEVWHYHQPGIHERERVRIRAGAHTQIILLCRNERSRDGTQERCVRRRTTGFSTRLAARPRGPRRVNLIRSAAKRQLSVLPMPHPTTI